MMQKVHKGDRVTMSDGTVVEVTFADHFGGVKGFPVNPETGSVQAHRKPRTGTPVAVVECGH